MKTYLVKSKENEIFNRYIIIKDDFLIYPQKIKLDGIDFLEWIKTNKSKIKTKYTNKYYSRTIDYVGEDDRIELLETNPFEFYFRVWESYNNFELGDVHPDDYEYFINSIEQFSAICNQLKELFSYIKPDMDNLKSFGNQNRNMILLSCTEVETQIIQILIANGYNKSNRLTTKDFYNIKSIMKLDEFEVSLKYFPRYPSVSPFKGWDDIQPTKSIFWYDAYNKVKHDREKNFNLSTLENVVNSIGAIYILLVAQYGQKYVDKELGNNLIFEIKKNPLIHKYMNSSYSYLSKEPELNPHILLIALKERKQYFKKS